MAISSKFDVLNKACEGNFICANGNQCEEVKKNKYILRRALVEFKQLIKDKATHGSNNGLRCYWLLRLEIELNYAFLQLLPFLNTRLMDVMHDDFVSAVHDAERYMKGYSSEHVHELHREKFDALGPELLGSFEEMNQDDRPCALVNIARLLLREWACTGTNGLNTGEVIVCPSNSALTLIVSNATKAYAETTMGLKRWVDEKVIPVLSKKLLEVDGIAFAENMTALFIETEEETGELLFLVESAYHTVAAD